MITKDDLAAAICAKFAEQFGGFPLEHMPAALIAADVANTMFAVDPDAPQTVTIMFKADVAKENLPQMMADLATLTRSVAEPSETAIKQGSEVLQQTWDASESLPPLVFDPKEAGRLVQALLSMKPAQ